ncbi:3-deoxy-D-manno-octulosonate 8-phosphate phosphatase [Synergistales bacterium]|nr:3-deoxy-D-manno-octulosonate 8-phosphate phosphatase [Synergistales bacterium]
MIRLFAMDVDGTLTDGGIYIGSSGDEFKKFDVRDGYAIVKLIKSGVHVAFISGRFSKVTDRRAAELGVKYVVNGCADKLPELSRIADELGVNASETAFIGDDLPDIPAIKWAGLGMAVRNAEDEVKHASDWVSPKRGGGGAVRAAAEHIARLNGTVI